MEKDRINGELIAIKQKLEESQNENAHLKITYERIQNQKDVSEQKLAHAAIELTEYREKVEIV